MSRQKLDSSIALVRESYFVSSAIGGFNVAGSGQKDRFPPGKWKYQNGLIRINDSNKIRSV